MVIKKIEGVDGRQAEADVRIMVHDLEERLQGFLIRAFQPGAPAHADETLAGRRLLQHRHGHGPAHVGDFRMEGGDFIPGAGAAAVEQVSRSKPRHEENQGQGELIDGPARHQALEPARDRPAEARSGPRFIQSVFVCFEHFVEALAQGRAGLLFRQDTQLGPDRAKALHLFPARRAGGQVGLNQLPGFILYLAGQEVGEFFPDYFAVHDEVPP